MLDIPEANTKEKSSSISAVWVIPIIAALIGGWLVFQSAAEEKVSVEVTFDSASGLEVGKSSVKLLDIKIGSVTEVKFSNDLSSVIVTMELEGIDQNSITDKTRFWVVRPRVGATGVSGLDTLLSGAYIEMDPGDGGVPATKFTGLEEPDIHQRGSRGTRYLLRSADLGSLSTGSPVKSRGIQVGKVTQYRLVDDHNYVEVEFFVAAPHDKYIKPSTRFWNISGVGVQLNSEGFQLNMESITSLMVGGIAFSNQEDTEGVPQAEARTVFNLYKTETAEIEEMLTLSVPIKLNFANGVNGLIKGAIVEFKGLRIGTVAKVDVEFSKNKKELLTFAIINIEPQRLSLQFEQALTNAERVANTYKFFEAMVEKGMRAQLTSGNILTGRSQVTLDFFPSMKNGKVKYVDGVMIFPTAKESLKGLLERVDAIMNRFETMPIEKIGQNVEQTTASINSLIKSLNAVEGGMTGVQISEAIDELTRAARSVRSMADYLERHPEALIKGKSSK